MNHAFSAGAAGRVLDKLGAVVTRTRVTMGIVHVTSTRRIRLSHPTLKASEAVLPSFTEQKWRQQLRLSAGEFLDLRVCTLDGPAALDFTRKRAEL